MTDLHPATRRIIERAGMTPATETALRRHDKWAAHKRALWADASPSWLRNSDEQQDTFDEDFSDYERQQWEGNGHE